MYVCMVTTMELCLLPTFCMFGILLIILKNYVQMGDYNISRFYFTYLI